VDGGYKAGLIHWCRSRYGVELEIVSTPPGQRGFSVQPRRWVSERSFAWLTPCRRLCVDHEEQTWASENMLWIAYSRLLIRRLA
jgi:transposase